MINGIYENPQLTYSIERLKNFLLRSGARQECSLSLLLLNIEVLTRAIGCHHPWQKKKKKKKEKASKLEGKK